MKSNESDSFTKPAFGGISWHWSVMEFLEQAPVSAARKFSHDGSEGMESFLS